MKGRMHRMNEQMLNDAGMPDRGEYASNFQASVRIRSHMRLTC